MRRPAAPADSTSCRADHRRTAPRSLDELWRRLRYLPPGRRRDEVGTENLESTDRRPLPLTACSRYRRRTQRPARRQAVVGVGIKVDAGGRRRRRRSGHPEASPDLPMTLVALDQRTEHAISANHVVPASCARGPHARLIAQRLANVEHNGTQPSRQSLIHPSIFARPRARRLRTNTRSPQCAESVPRAARPGRYGTQPNASTSLFRTD